MIIVDTNVVAEVMRASPAPAVVAWFNAQRSASLFLTAITVGEIRYGLRIMPKGQRRQPIEQGFDQIIATATIAGVLPRGFVWPLKSEVGVWMPHPPQADWGSSAINIDGRPPGRDLRPRRVTRQGGNL